MFRAHMLKRRLSALAADTVTKRRKELVWLQTGNSSTSSWMSLNVAESKANNTFQRMIPELTTIRAVADAADK